VFQLVPCAFHDRAYHLYSAIGQPEITINTFWDIYLDLLARLRVGTDEVLVDILSNHQQTSSQPDADMPLLPNMQPFRLGQPLNAGRNTDYIGGIDISALPSSVPVPRPEYAYITSDEESDSDGNDGELPD
jgi:hypothetical protein